jgi:hypothetical protein
LVAANVCGAQYPQAGVPQAPSSRTGDPPGRVGRLSIIDGPVSFLAAGAESWAEAEPNRPITTGDGLWADNAGRAEIDIGSTALRLSGQTEADILRLNDHWLQVRVPQGTLSERVRLLAPDQDDETDTPNAAVTLAQAGEYRVSVSPDGATTTVTVWSGEADVTAAGSTFPVKARQVATIHGEGQLTYDLTDAGAPDEFDSWARGRDARADQATAARRYVSEDTPGVADLDPYGRWDTDANYGPIWYPSTVDAGWAPYRQGHWVWVGRWGWTWVDDAPWGFAPYHYGRWANVGGRWGWSPGRVIAEPTYAPALVVFVGGQGWNVGAGSASRAGVAWFPLAPGEVYYPSYTTGADYRQRINVTNVTNVTVINNVTNVTEVTYRNRGVAGAVTAVPTQVFVSAQPVRRAVVEVPAKDLASAHVVVAAPVAPTTASLVAGVPARRPPPVALATRQAVATHAPPPAPVPFTAQQRQLEGNGGRPLTPAQLAMLRPAAPAAGPAAMPVRSAVVAGPGAQKLTPARPALPVTPQPATKVFAAPPVTPVAPPAVPQAAKPQPAQPPRAREPGPKAAQTPPPAAAPAPPVQAAKPAPPPAQKPPTSAPPAQAAELGQRPAPKPPTAAPSPPAQPAQTTARPPATPLDQSYQAERAATEARHRQEFAKPPAGESPAALAQRQEAEDQDLTQRYQQARTQGTPTLPPKGAAPVIAQKPAVKAPPKAQKPAERAPPKAQNQEGDKQ